jgi:hypothetical protein
MRTSEKEKAQNFRVRSRPRSSTEGNENEVKKKNRHYFWICAFLFSREEYRSTTAYELDLGWNKLNI